MDAETGGRRLGMMGRSAGSELGARDAEREEGVGYAKLGDTKGWSDNVVSLGVGNP
jgi:hypothetical protein